MTPQRTALERYGAPRVLRGTPVGNPLTVYCCSVKGPITVRLESTLTMMKLVLLIA